jgi:DNA-binding SARP family transcriptional activator
MRIDMLGPLEIVVDGAVRTPTTPKVRTVLALLLMDTNETVSTDTIIEELWGSAAPRSATGTIQTYIYQLRKVLHGLSPPGSDDQVGLVTKPAGYQLRVDPECIDIYEFESLVRRGRDALHSGDSERASALLHEGLRLWRGQPLGGVERGQRLGAYVARLEENRLSALECRIEADLKVGRHRELVGELKALVAAHPMHEWLYSRLMLALHMSGRRIEALEVFQSLRRGLREELGLDPSAELQQMQRALLAGSVVGYRPSGPANGDSPRD